jgi:N-acetylneuraminic acid mutarotase
MKTKQMLLLLSIISSGILSCKKGSSTTTIPGNWVTKSSFNGVARSEAVSFVINDTAFIGTGFDGTNRLADIWEYDAVKDYWIQKADFPGPARNSAIAFTVSGKGYVGTGFDGVNKLKDMYQFDPVANSWLRKNDFAGSARYDAVGFGILDKGYISTGFDGNYLKDFYQYDPLDDTWTLEPGFGGSKRMAAVAFVHSNKAYICTGTNNGIAVSDFWSFDPSTAAWTQLRQISNISTDTYDDLYTGIARSNAVAFTIGDKAYLTTGENGSLYSTTWEYDFASDQWTATQAFEGAARTGAVAFSISLGGYVTTGRSSTNPFDDLREFFPDQTYNAND